MRPYGGSGATTTKGTQCLSSALKRRRVSLGAPLRRESWCPRPLAILKRQRRMKNRRAQPSTINRDGCLPSSIQSAAQSETLMSRQATQHRRLSKLTFQLSMMSTGILPRSSCRTSERGRQLIPPLMFWANEATTSRAGMFLGLRDSFEPACGVGDNEAPKGTTG